MPGDVTTLSTPRMPASKTSARAIAGMVPSSTRSIEVLLMPLITKSPRPPAPITVATVPIPTRAMPALRTPAMMTGVASGSSIWKKIWLGVMPMPRPESMIALSTLLRPA